MNKGPRLFRSVRNMALEEAFTNLGIEPGWLDGFKKSGEHYESIRYMWRRMVLKHHPDKQVMGWAAGNGPHVT